MKIINTTAKAAILNYKSAFLTTLDERGTKHQEAGEILNEKARQYKEAINYSLYLIEAGEERKELKKAFKNPLGHVFIVELSREELETIARQTITDPAKREAWINAKKEPYSFKTTGQELKEIAERLKKAAPDPDPLENVYTPERAIYSIIEEALNPVEINANGEETFLTEINTTTEEEI